MSKCNNNVLNVVDRAMLQRINVGGVMGQEPMKSQKFVCVSLVFVLKETNNKKTLPVIVERGAPNGHEIRFPKAAEQKPGFIPGDVIVKLKQKNHNRFARHGNDLHTTVELSLKKALCGFDLTIRHLGEPGFVSSFFLGLFSQNFVCKKHTQQKKKKSQKSSIKSQQ
jgi:hypothetical protein